MTKEILLGRDKNTAFYEHEQTIIDQTTGEILSSVKKTIAKTASEPDYVKVYYETMMAFNRIHDIPVSFVLSLSKFLEWTNDGNPQCVTLNKRIKGMMCEDCSISLPQIDRYIKKSVDTGLLFRTEFRGVYEVNPFMIAKGKWESIKLLRTQFDFIDGKWIREIINKDDTDNEKQQPCQNDKVTQLPGQQTIIDKDMRTAEIPSIDMDEMMQFCSESF